MLWKVGDTSGVQNLCTFPFLIVDTWSAERCAARPTVWTFGLETFESNESINREILKTNKPLLSIKIRQSTIQFLTQHTNLFQKKKENQSTIKEENWLKEFHSSQLTRWVVIKRTEVTILPASMPNSLNNWIYNKNLNWLRVCILYMTAIDNCVKPCDWKWRVLFYPRKISFLVNVLTFCHPFWGCDLPQDTGHNPTEFPVGNKHTNIEQKEWKIYIKENKEMFPQK